MSEFNLAYVQKARVPHKLLRTTIADIPMFEDAFKRFMEQYSAYNIVLVEGEISPYKDMFLVLMLKWFLQQNNKLIANYGYTSDTVDLMVIPSIEAMFNKEIAQSIPRIAEHFNQKRYLIVDVPSVEYFQSLVGKELFKYFSYSMGVITLDCKQTTTIKEI